MSAALGACGNNDEDKNIALDLPEPAAARVQQTVSFEASDGVKIHAIITAASELKARPLIVEFSPYGMASAVPDFGPDYNHVFVHARGSGASQGVWSAVGPRDQLDVAEFLAWACEQPWSNGRIGLYGFSASAIAIYNAMHLPLSCVDAAALMAGTNDLYRDLLYPGGIPNLVPAVGVGVGVGAPLLASLPDRMQKNPLPLDMLQSGLGFLLDLAPSVLLLHPSADAYWQDRTHRPGPNRFPVLIDTGFYDVESRGPFESYKMLRASGVQVHLRVFGAHDGFPKTTAGPFPEYRRWFDRYLLDVNNGIEHEPRVQLLVGHGSYEALMDGQLTQIDANDWPVPGTRWQPLYLSAERGGAARSLNDGTLALSPPVTTARQGYPALTSLPTATDPYTTALLSAGGGSLLFRGLPFLVELGIMEPLSLTYTTPPLTDHIEIVGPASLNLFLSTLLPEGDIQAVLADVWPDGSAHPVASGRLRTSYPFIVEERTERGEDGEVVQPYNDFSVKTYAVPGQTRQYHVEFWPIGNRFQAGHRLRLYLTGAAAYMLPAPGINFVSVGGDTASHLMLPVLIGSDISKDLLGQ
ncbi:MAG: CocE/NonD family hydrolase [Moraxellaceae bacterium]|nr:CocE/NonD family hydrolase [Moraxellaceae bacterium]MDP1774981.1 CocE/NonD family hydrolase [Moraxellaceae bacterium]